jgi:hypothetical protein
VIIGIVVAVIMVPITGLFVAGFVIGLQRARAKAVTAAALGSASATSVPTAFDQTYPTKNGLVVAHYPSDFAAKNLDHATLVLTKNLGDGTSVIVQLAGVQNPISDDVNEFSRILVNAMVKSIEAAGDTFTETSRTPKTCFRNYSGLEIEGTFAAKGISKTNVRVCFFMTPNRGYLTKSIVPAVHEAAELPKLQAIIDATDIKG